MTGLHGRPKRLCVFQMHHTDVSPLLETYNAVVKVRDSGFFDHVVLAAPDLPENRVLVEWANKWGIDIHFGSVENVALRIHECCELYKCESVARALVWWFFLDTRLLNNLVRELDESKADLVNLPKNFDIRFGADVFTKAFLEKVLLALSDEGLREQFQLNPWGYAELHPQEFDIRTYTHVPIYGEPYFKELRGRMRTLWPERWEQTGAQVFPYRKAVSYIQPGGKILDVACGLGAGTSFLSRYGKAVGIDIDPETISTCRQRHGEHDGLKFILSDANEVDLPENEFDLVISVHTMEHLIDDREFLFRVSRWLKPGGKFVLEVPLLLELPFKDVKTPLSPFHEREYVVATLMDLVSEFLLVTEAFGVNRGYYTELENSRNAALLVCKKE